MRGSPGQNREGKQMEQSDCLLEVKNLYVSSDGIDIVRGVNFALERGEFLGIAGESGCGKTTLLRALMLLRRKGNAVRGSIRFDGRELTGLGQEELRQLRGSALAMIPQNAFAAMDGTKTISSLFRETLLMHRDRRVSRRESDRLASAWMEKLLLEDVERILRSYPFELSGGMCQRVLIAAAMLNEPQLLLGDEPTSALDMTSQMQVMKELELLKAEHRVSMILVSHNLRAISQIADTAAVMYGGRIVEYGSREELFSRALHPYTRALFAALPDAEGNLSAGLPGLPPAFEKEMRGCPFAARCPYSMEKCRRELPEDRMFGERHRVQCFRAEEFADGAS